MVEDSLEGCLVRPHAGHARQTRHHAEGALVQGPGPQGQHQGVHQLGGHHRRPSRRLEREAQSETLWIPHLSEHLVKRNPLGNQGDLRGTLEGTHLLVPSLKDPHQGNPGWNKAHY